MITLNNIFFDRNGQQLITDCSLHIGAEEAVCLTGPSGIGKTTLLEVAAGLTTPNQGRVILGSKRIGCVFQDDILVPWLTAMENMLLIMPDNTPDNSGEAWQWLDRFGLEPDVRPTQMSGGMRRRLSLARAFVIKPDILILDEPFAFLDDHWQEQIAEHVESARIDGAAILLASHQVRHLDKIDCNLVTFSRKQTNRIATEHLD